MISSTHVPSSGTEFGVAFRLAEAYLNLAEGAALSNDPVTARAAINTLREHRFTPETYTPMPELTGQDLIIFVKNGVWNFVMKDSVGLIYVVMVCLLSQEIGW